jgi:cytidine deaminase
MMDKHDDSIRDEMVRIARDARANAYAPYSNYSVGACVRTDDGRLYAGCNVENASFGMTICAERTAVVKAVSEGARRFTAIAVAAEGAMPYPCGACRQVLSEFADGGMIVWITDGDAIERTELSALLPYNFIINHQ